MAQTIYVVKDEYQYDGEQQSTELILCKTKEIAIRKLKERWEWYKKHSYLSQFFDESGNVDSSEFDEDWGDSCEINDDSVSINYSSKDTWLELYIVEETLLEE